MSKFNEIKKVERPLNYMGSPALSKSAELELVSILLTSFAEDEYYRKSEATFSRLKELIAQCDKKFVAQAAVYARTKFGMRSITHIAASELAKHIGGEVWAKDFYSAIIHRPDDMLEIWAYHIANNGKVPNSIKKGFAKAFDKFDDYTLAKYKGENKSVKLIDLVNLIHPKATEKNANALKNLVKGQLKSFDTWESELTKAGQIADNEDEKQELKKEAWERLINDGKIGYFALLRNLRNIIQQAPSVKNRVVELLTDSKRIKNSLVLPFRFLSAYTEIEKLKTESPTFEKDGLIVSDILKALDDAMKISVENLPTLQGRTLILSDNSGSMTGDRGGASLMSRLSDRKKSDIANLFSVLYWLKADNTLVGLFGDNLIYPKLDRGKGVFDNFKIIDQAKNQCGASTERGIFDMFEHLLSKKIKVDTIVVFSDCQIGDGCKWYDQRNNQGHDFVKLYRQYQAFHPSIRAYSVDLTTYGTTVFDDSIIKICGFSDKIFDIMKMAELDKNALVSEIRNVQF